MQYSNVFLWTPKPTIQPANLPAPVTHPSIQPTIQDEVKLAADKAGPTKFFRSRRPMNNLGSSTYEGNYLKKLWGLQVFFWCFLCVFMGFFRRGEVGFRSKIIQDDANGNLCGTVLLFFQSPLFECYVVSKLINSYFMSQPSLACDVKQTPKSCLAS